MITGKKTAETVGIAGFIQSEQRNQWVREGHASVYLRRSHRLVEGRMLPFLDLGSIEVDEEERGKGELHRVLERMIGTGMNIYVERILSPEVEHVCLKMGFTYHTNEELNKNMYRIQE